MSLFIYDLDLARGRIADYHREADEHRRVALALTGRSSALKSAWWSRFGVLRRATAAPAQAVMVAPPCSDVCLDGVCVGCVGT